MTVTYNLWRAELRSPTPEDQRHNRPNEPGQLSGFWRILGARTRIDWPLAIWTETDPAINKKGATIFQIGSKIRDTITDGKEWDEFTQSSWLNTVAVSEDDYHSAMKSGRWPDGKAARHISAEEKLDIIPDTPAAEGGNIDEGVDTFHEQIKVKIEALVEKGEALTKTGIRTMEQAEQAAAIIEPLRGLGQQGEAKRRSEKAPWDAGAAAVQNKWVPVLQPASGIITQLVTQIELFKAAERARLKKEAAEAAEVERKRLQKIADDEAEAERERLQKIADAEAAAKGETAELVDVVPEKIEVSPVEVSAPAVRTAHGRAVSKAKLKRGVIDDVYEFISALSPKRGSDGRPVPFDQWPDSDFKQFLQDKADRLARAETALSGMRITRE